MGKSIRCKVKKRLRTLKREQYEVQLGRDRLQKISDKLQNNPSFHDQCDVPKKNAFLYPNDPDAVFPQFQKQDMIDFRNDKVEFSGYEFRGSSRKNKPKNGLLNQVHSTELDMEMEEIPEVEPVAEEDGVAENEEEFLDDFGNMGIGGATKKIKKQKFERMETESSKDFLSFKSKKSKKDKGGCKKSRKIMRW